MPKVLLPNGLNIHYVRAGDGPDLVMIHGLSGNLAVWHLKMVPVLRDHFRVTSYDLRGHGYSDVPPTGYTTGDMATDLEQLLDALGIERCDIVGHSYGADAALYLALRHPERIRKIIAIEAGLAALITLRKREDWEGWAYWAQVLEEFGFPVPPEKRTDIDYMLRESLKVPKIFGPASGRPRKAEPLLRLLDTTMVKDYEVVGDLTLDALSRIQTPVQLIYGQSSAFLGTYRYLIEHLTNVTGTLLPVSKWGHFGVLEQPELLNQHIIAYLRPDADFPDRSDALTGASRSSREG
jgi:pimeloyl-ACP methyl ester carboxylesterase